jgi:hypothetical protein
MQRNEINSARVNMVRNYLISLVSLGVSRLFWVSSLAYPNLFGTKGYVVVVVVVWLALVTVTRKLLLLDRKLQSIGYLHLVVLFSLHSTQ